MTNFLTLLVLSLGAWAMPPTAVAAVSVSISVRIAPPLLPVYIQPAPPAPDFLWMPGYWAWDDAGYYWVPGTWVMAPRHGYLWTPGYWAWGSGLYYWHQGYWGPTVGYYGGVAYGYGYYGSGYDGGRWEGDHFYYNRAVNNVNVTYVKNTYHETVVHNTTTINRVSYNGGEGGVTAQPRERDRRTEREPRLAFTDEQAQHEKDARGNRALRAAENQGAPPIAATPRPGAFTHRDARPATKAADPRQGDGKAPSARQPAETRQPRRTIEQPLREKSQPQRQRDTEAHDSPAAADEPGQPAKGKRLRKDRNKEVDAEPDSPR